jgi:hypothetical protein
MLGQNFTYFYVHNLTKVLVVLVQNPTFRKKNFMIYLKKKCYVVKFFTQMDFKKWRNVTNLQMD